MGVPKRLTEMQKRFAEYLIFGGPERCQLIKLKQQSWPGYSVRKDARHRRIRA
jgi:hypothetical protein